MGRQAEDSTPGAADRIGRRMQELIDAGVHADADLSEESAEHVAAILHGHGSRQPLSVA